MVAFVIKGVYDDQKIALLSIWNLYQYKKSIIYSYEIRLLQNWELSLIRFNNTSTYDATCDMSIANFYTGNCKFIRYCDWYIFI